MVRAEQAGENGEPSDEASVGVSVLASERRDRRQCPEIPDRDLALPTIVVTPARAAREAARSEPLEDGGSGEASRPDVHGVSGGRAHKAPPSSLMVGPRIIRTHRATARRALRPAPRTLHAGRWGACLCRVRLAPARVVLLSFVRCERLGIDVETLAPTRKRPLRFELRLARGAGRVRRAGPPRPRPRV